jgi:hypothetical protein
MDKQNVHIHTMENYPVLNRKKILTHAMTWISWGHYSKWYKLVTKDNYCMNVL